MSIATLSPSTPPAASARVRKPMHEVLPGNRGLNRILASVDEVLEKQRLALIDRRVERLVVKWHAYGKMNWTQISERLCAMSEPAMARTPAQVRRIITSVMNEKE